MEIKILTKVKSLSFFLSNVIENKKLLWLQRCKRFTKATFQQIIKKKLVANIRGTRN